jgi:hypothetical protein
VPLPIIADILGLPRTDLPMFRRRSELIAQLTFLPFRSPEQEALAKENADLLETYFLDVIAARRRQPGDDLISDLVAARMEDRALNNDEIVQICFLMLFAGNLTTTDMIANGIVLLLSHPQEAAKLRADPSLARSAVEEVLRCEPPVINTGRHTRA